MLWLELKLLRIAVPKHLVVLSSSVHVVLVEFSWLLAEVFTVAVPEVLLSVDFMLLIDNFLSFPFSWFWFEDETLLAWAGAAKPQPDP